MKIALSIVFGFILLIIQTTIFPPLGLKPNLFLPLVIVLGAVRGPVEGAATACAIGYLADLFLHAPRGFFMFISVLCCLLTHLVSRRLYLRSLRYSIPWVYLMAVLMQLLAAGLLVAFQSGYSTAHAALKSLFLQALVTAIFSTPILLTTRWFKPQIQREQRETLRG